MAFSAPVGFGTDVSITLRKSFSGDWRTYADLDWDREKVATSFLCNAIATRNTWKIDESRLYDTFLSIQCPDEAFGEAEAVRG